MSAVSPRIPITFAPEGVTVRVESGTTVADAAKAAGIVIASPCGGRGVCGSCGVRVLSGTLGEPDHIELSGLARAREGVRLACRARVVAPVEVRPLIAQPRASATGPAGPGGAQPALVAGVDLGTTSVAAVLIDARTRVEIARSSVPNLQHPLGADVLTRISAALDGEGARLRTMAEQSVLDALSACAIQADVSLSGVKRLVIAGNSAMSALLSGIDTRPLAAHPFTAPAIPRTLKSKLLSDALHSGAEILLVPAIASFVGGDALAGLMATGMTTSGAAVLLVDLGTNAEILFARPGRLVVASAAAGPAFEGAGISCGGPAADGAVSAVSVAPDGRVGLEVMGGGEPLWFSGSGVVSALAALLRVGHLDASGLMHAEGPLEARYLVDERGVAGLALGEGGGLVITQLDVRSVQLAKAAIHVGIESVLRIASCRASELAEVLVAGAFGFSLLPADLVGLGVLPMETLAIARRVGNSSLDGAGALALDKKLVDRAERIAASAEHLELAGPAGFSEAFLAAMALEPYSLE